MCLVIGSFMMAFGWFYLPTNPMVSLFSFVVGGVLLGVFAWRFYKYKMER